MNRDKLIEHQREEIKALKAANLDLQIHFDTMKADLQDSKITEPKGWKLVPLIATEEMLDHMDQGLYGPTQEAYKGMLNAAPVQLETK